MSTAACPTCAPVVLPTRRPWLRRWLIDAHDAWLRWSRRAPRPAGWYAPQGLSDAALRDIGLADHLPPREPHLLARDPMRWL